MAAVVTDVGLALVTDRVMGVGGNPPRWLDWGTGAGVAAVTDAALFTESTESRVSGTMSRETVSTTNDTYQVVGTITANGTKTITNVGVLDVSSKASGILFFHADFAGVLLQAGESIEFTLQSQFTN